MMDKYYVPKYLDEPFKIFLLTIDEIIFLIVPVLSGLFIFDASILGFIMGGGMVLLLKTIKGGEGHHFIYHFAYWYLPSIIQFRSTPPSYIREILG